MSVRQQHRKRVLRSAILGFSLTLVGHAAGAAATDPVQAAIAHHARPLEDRAQDASRAPAEKIAFAEIKPGMKIAEFVPGDAYYTRILSVLVGKGGKVYPVVPLYGFVDSAEARKAANGKLLPVDTELAIEDTSLYSNVAVFWENVGQNGGQFALPEQIDAIWALDTWSALHTDTLGKPDMAGVEQGMFAALKPGGTVYISEKGLDSERAKTEAKAAGFMLDAEKHDGDRVSLRFKKPPTAVGDKRPKDDPLRNYYGNTYLVNADAPDFTRYNFYTPDHVYTEFAKGDYRVGTWFWDAQGRFCIVHEYPHALRRYIFCNPNTKYRQVGDVWQTKANRPAPPHQAPAKLVKGEVYPETK
jgi:predicted methyltransferase